MSNLAPEDTGVAGAVIWFAAGEYSHRDSHHGPRIQVAVGRTLTIEGLGASVPVRLTNPPDVLGALPRKVEHQAVAFVIANRNVLLGHWHRQIDTETVMKLLVRV